MPERKNLAKIDVVTDDDSGNYYIGEVDGGFREDELRNHIKQHGHQELCSHLAYLQFQVWSTLRQINSESNQQAAVSAKISYPTSEPPL